MNISTTSNSSNDLLASMQPAMNTAFEVGVPTNADGASAILATSGDYIRGAQATMSKVEDGIEQRRTELETVQASNPKRAAELQQQIDLLERLRDRIQLSIERVTKNMSGHPDDASDDGDDEAALARARQRRLEQKRAEEHELLQRRHDLLSGAVHDSLIAPVDSTNVAATYASTGASDPR